MVQKVEMVDWLNTRNWDGAGNSFSASGGWEDPYSRLALAVLTCNTAHKGSALEGAILVPPKKFNFFWAPIQKAPE